MKVIRKGMEKLALTSEIDLDRNDQERRTRLDDYIDEFFWGKNL